MNSHLHTYLNSLKIPFFSIPKIGVSIETKYYNFDHFNKFENRITFLDSTFIINY
jgi:hypothetical protein